MSPLSQAQLEALTRRVAVLETQLTTANERVGAERYLREKAERQRQRAEEQLSEMSRELYELKKAYDELDVQRERAVERLGYYEARAARRCG